MTPASEPLAALQNKPWERAFFDFPVSIYSVRGMIRTEERRCYYYFARNYFSGAGHIVDAGCFCGSSTFAFAAGAGDRGIKEYEGKKLIHAYDYFEIKDDYVKNSIDRMFGTRELGASYLDIFEAQLADYLDMIDVHPGDFLSHRWSGQPIEILFVDICKTLSLNKHLVEQFFRHLIPGRSILIQQDYYHAYHPYIHVTMEYLADEFELIDEYVHGSSRVWRLRKAIPEEKLRKLAAFSFDGVELDILLKRTVDRSSYEMRPMMEVVRLVNLHHLGLKEDAAKQVAAIRGRYDPDTSSNVWAYQFRDVATKIDNAMSERR